MLRALRNLIRNHRVIVMRTRHYEAWAEREYQEAWDNFRFPRRIDHKPDEFMRVIEHDNRGA